MATTVRGKRKSVYVTIMNGRLNYGWLISPRGYGYKTELGFKDHNSDSQLVFYGANYPKPGKASKIISGSGATGATPVEGLSESVSSYFDPTKADSLKAANWIISNNTARLKGVKTTGRVRTYYVEMAGGSGTDKVKYTWNSRTADADGDFQTLCGVQIAASADADNLVWGINRPKPPRASLQKNGVTVSSYISTDNTTIDALLAAGATITGLDARFIA